MIKRIKNYVHEQSDDDSESMESEQTLEEKKNKFILNEVQDYSHQEKIEEIENMREIVNQNQDIELKVMNKKNNKKIEPELA